jgi:hypothetical protein
MIEPARRFPIFKERFIMDSGFTSADQVVLPAQVWARLPTPLQQQIVHLVARLATQLILAEEESLSLTQKEAQDVIPSITFQSPS